jgi:hypothetical protein
MPKGGWPGTSSCHPKAAADEKADQSAKNHESFHLTLVF